MRRSFNLIFGLALVSLFAAGLAAWYNSRRLMDLSHHDRQAMALLDNVHMLVSRARAAESSQRRYILTGAYDDWSTYSHAVRALQLEMDALPATVQGAPGYEVHATRLASLVGERLDELEEMARIRESQGLAAVREVMGTRAASEMMDRIVELASAIREELAETAFSSRLEVEARTRHTANFITFMSIFGLLTVAFSAYLINRHFTERLTAERRLIAAKEEAERANRAKSDFLAQMSHELRTPLNAIIGFTNILRKNKSGNLGEQELDYLQRVHNNGVHLLALINDILDLSKVEAGRLTLEFEEVDLAPLVKEVLEQLSAQSENTGVELLSEAPSGLRPIRADRVKLRQVLLNLVGNALKFTSCGSVRVVVVADQVTGTPQRIDVIDTGIGIPEEDIPKIFRPFEQLESGTTRRFGGTGLGLAISDAISRQMGFRIEVTSEVGVGSTFSIVMTSPSDHSPGRQAQPPARTRRPASTVLVPGAGRRVLIISDDTTARPLLTASVEELGYGAVAAASLEEGLALARESEPDLIMLDLQLPGTSASDAVRLIRSAPDLGELPVVIVSILAEEAAPSLGGVVEILVKPVRRDALERVLERTLGAATGGRVLVVEDDSDTRTLLAALLHEMGLEAVGAANGCDALDHLDTYRPDLILLDLIMPQMDGLSFLKVLRRDPRFGGIPVVVITAKDTTISEAEYLRGVTGAVIRKGAHLEDDLRRTISDLLERVPA